MASGINGLKTDALMHPFDTFPNRLVGELCWSSENFDKSMKKYIVDLSEEHIHAVERAIVFFKGTQMASSFGLRLTVRL